MITDIFIMNRHLHLKGEEEIPPTTTVPYAGQEVPMSINHMSSSPRSYVLGLAVILTFGSIFQILPTVQTARVTKATHPYDSFHVQSLTDQRQHQRHHEYKLPGSPKAATPSANIIFFLADDQDLHLESLSYQPLVKKHLIDEGVTFRHHFCTVALCCPSRVNLWTGLAAHNTNVTDLSPPYGKILSKCVESTSVRSDASRWLS